eukprot:CAMPEP_0174278890 /NCGR_PEP_ID=MMETSP0439-20130205/61723_1 /TAXON_ID=0 /ORGANISM="Stereomyxa ramosa, Strain Chinc5" /LENGTH=501 /DNA_ID=CAMNT_0015371341 /DNA_START=736 /DNA_END=2241 /DNA_ORIENTATION=+
MLTEKDPELWTQKGDAINAVTPKELAEQRERAEILELWDQQQLRKMLSESKCSDQETRDSVERVECFGGLSLALSEKPLTVDIGSPIICMVSYSKNIFFSGHQDGSISQWKFKGSKWERKQWHGHNNSVSTMIVIEIQGQANKRVLITGGFDKAICVWDPILCKKHVTLTGHSSAINILAGCSDGTFYSSSADQPLKKWELFYDEREPGNCSITGDCMVSLKLEGPIVSLKVLSDNTILTTCENCIYHWEITSGMVSCLHVLRGHRGKVTSLCVSQNEDHLISVGADHCVRVWEIMKGGQQRYRCLLTLVDSNDTSASFSYNSLVELDEGYFLVGSPDKSIRIWKINDEQNELLTEPETCSYILGQQGRINAMEVLGLREFYFAAASSDGQIKFWKLHDKSKEIVLDLPFSTATRSSSLGPRSPQMVPLSQQKIREPTSVVDDKLFNLLDSLGLLKFLPNFQEQEITYEILLCMDYATLKDLQLPLGPTVKLSRKLEKLRK